MPTQRDALVTGIARTLRAVSILLRDRRGGDSPDNIWATLHGQKLVINDGRTEKAIRSLTS